VTKLRNFSEPRFADDPEWTEIIKGLIDSGDTFATTFYQAAHGTTLEHHDPAFQGLFAKWVPIARSRADKDAREMASAQSRRPR